MKEDLTNKHNVTKIGYGILAFGVIICFLGICAILLPFMAALAVEFFLAVILLAAGIINLLKAFTRALPGLLMDLILSLLYILVGVILLTFPWKAIISLTMFLALFFLIAGVLKIVKALYVRPLPIWKWLLTSGILAIAIGIFILLGLPEAATWVIGLLVGIELLFGGGVLMLFAVTGMRQVNEV